MRLREDYLRHKSKDNYRLKTRSGTKLARQLETQANNISEAAFTAESLLYSIQTMAILDTATSQMTKLAAYSAAEEVVASAEDAMASVAEVSALLSEPMGPDISDSELVFTDDEEEEKPHHSLYQTTRSTIDVLPEPPVAPIVPATGHGARTMVATG